MLVARCPTVFPVFRLENVSSWEECGKPAGGVTNLFSFSIIFFPIFFYILSLVSRRCGWGRSFNVWNSSFRSKNGELGRSVGVWNWLSAPWTCLFRQLKIVHGANQREPRVWFSVKNDRHQSRGDVCTLHQYAFIRSAGVITRVYSVIWEPEACLVSSDTREGASCCLRAPNQQVFSRMLLLLGSAGLADFIEH